MKKPKIIKVGFNPETMQEIISKADKKFLKSLKIYKDDGKDNGKSEFTVVVEDDEPKIYISDNSATMYYYSGRSVNYEHLGDRNYKVTPTSGDFSDIPYTPRETTFFCPYGQALVSEKTDEYMIIYTTYNHQYDTSIWFHIAISDDHAIWCRDKFLNETEGIIDPENVYVGTISIGYNVLGMCEVFGIDIISRSYSGLNDVMIGHWGIMADGMGKKIVHAHQSNIHELILDPSYMGEIVACGASDGVISNINCRSYGDGLFFFIDNEKWQSYATPRIAGMIAKLNKLTGCSYNEAVGSLCNTASFPEWIRDGGYGAVKYELALASFTTKPLETRPEFKEKDRALIDE